MMKARRKRNEMGNLHEREGIMKEKAGPENVEEEVKEREEWEKLSRREMRCTGSQEGRGTVEIRGRGNFDGSTRKASARAEAEGTSSA